MSGKINPLYLALGAAVAVLAFLAYKKGVAGVASGIASGAVDAVNGVVSGSVIGIGSAIGVPATNIDQCALDRAAGKTWDASFSCDAGTFLKYLATGK